MLLYLAQLWSEHFFSKILPILLLFVFFRAYIRARLNLTKGASRLKKSAFHIHVEYLSTKIRNIDAYLSTNRFVSQTILYFKNHSNTLVEYLRNTMFIKYFSNLLNRLSTVVSEFKLNLQKTRQYYITKYQDTLVSLWSWYSAHKYFNQVEHLRKSNFTQIIWIIIRLFFYAYIWFFLYSAKAYLAIFPWSLYSIFFCWRMLITQELYFNSFLLNQYFNYYQYHVVNRRRTRINMLILYDAWACIRNDILTLYVQGIFLYFFVLYFVLGTLKLMYILYLVWIIKHSKKV